MYDALFFRILDKRRDEKPQKITARDSSISEKNTTRRHVVISRSLFHALSSKRTRTRIYRKSDRGFCDQQH